jgi:putative metal-binding protein
MSKSATLVGLALSLSAVVGRTTPALARAGGIVTDSCQACHGNGAAPPELSLTAEPATFNPGDVVNFTLAVRASSLKVGGAFITTGGIGGLRALAGQGLQVNGQGLTHTAPKAAVDGAVTFRFAWQAPAKAGGVDILVAALAGNGNNLPAGDSAKTSDFQWAFGCAAQTFYLDLDRDGTGAKTSGTMLGCGGEVPTGFATTDGDCDENDETVHPGATETCNDKDDNCDGRLDEGSSPVTMWPDKDGDGYYGSQLGTPKMGCSNLPGYAAQGGDCNDVDPAIHPRAVDICNLRDDDCDGNVDEQARPRCGVGWCARQSLSCDVADCQPGPPMAESCNAFDDDCDGEIDNDACPSGYVCAGDACVPAGSGGSGGGATLDIGGRGNGGGSSLEPPDRGTVNEMPPASGCAMAPAPQRRPARSGSYGEPFAMLVGAGCMAVPILRRKKRRR